MALGSYQRVNTPLIVALFKLPPYSPTFIDLANYTHAYPSVNMSLSTQLLPSISTWGESTHSRPAQLATLHIAVSADGESQDVVSGNVSSTSATIRSMLRSMTDAWADEDSVQRPPLHSDTQSVATPASKPVSKWSSSNLSTGYYLRYPERSGEVDAASTHSTLKAEGTDAQLQRRFTATQTFVATFTDFPSLGPFAANLSTMPNVSISNVTWSLTPATHASLATKSRKDAVGDAVKRATDLADGLMALDERSGSKKREIRCIEIKEEQDRFGGYGNLAMARAAPGGRSDGDRREELVFEPEEVGVRCGVEARFDLVSVEEGASTAGRCVD